MESNEYLKYLLSTQRIANTTRAEIIRYMLLPLIPAAALLDIAYYLHSKRMFGPFERGWIMGLNFVGGLVLLCCVAALMTTLLLKAGRRRLPTRLHRLSDTASTILGFVTASALGLFLLTQIARQYESLETSALAKRGVTVSLPVVGRQFHGGAFAGYSLFFRLPGAQAPGRRYSVRYPHDQSVDTVTRLTIRYLPANPEIYRCVDAWYRPE